MNPAKTALILVGFQNDYFADDGIVRGVVEDPQGVDRVLDHTLAFIRALAPTDATIISILLTVPPPCLGLILTAVVCWVRPGESRELPCWSRVRRTGKPHCPQSL